MNSIDIQRAEAVRARTLAGYGRMVQEFRKNIVTHLAGSWDVSYDDAALRVKKWLEANPNPNDPERRGARIDDTADKRDALLHAACMKKWGGIERKHLLPEVVGVWNKKANQWEKRKVSLGESREPVVIPEDVPEWVTSP